MARPTARQRGYGSAWEKARAAHLAAHPRCTHPGCTAQAVHVHHARPHRGNMAVFWDRSLWRGLCAEHHNRDAQQRERRGYASAVGADGLPADRAHPFLKDST
ncbi:hypothetical protein Q8W71_06840 [Methylobacterium sp. NEAU 140]|uniref:hypothetical protein n=1 Tax=Methylobacterium sp. NEAU 140 TaxID=3064945 RepID=UPI0027339170|nr:hypothetical protein [Methylobacterium sp. NEAU 140]MDP4022333.1 hypothetical protein [Methylobacterium sp. NEAU 140]